MGLISAKHSTHAPFSSQKSRTLSLSPVHSSTFNPSMPVGLTSKTHLATGHFSPSSLLDLQTKPPHLLPTPPLPSSVHCPLTPPPTEHEGNAGPSPRPNCPLPALSWTPSHTGALLFPSINRQVQVHLRSLCSLCPLLKNTLLPWLVWLSGLSAGLRTTSSPVRFPVRVHMPGL